MSKLGKLVVCWAVFFAGFSVADAAERPRSRVRRRTEARTGEAQGALEQLRERMVEMRQVNQARRIEHGVRRGYLTADELAKLDGEQKALADMATRFREDQKLTRDEMVQLRTALNQASIHIWAEKHDTEGNQMPVYRLGKTVFAKNELTSILQQDDLSGAQARQLIRDFHRTLCLRHKLATADLSAEERAKFQAEYDDLLNRYFEIR